MQRNRTIINGALGGLLLILFFAGGGVAASQDEAPEGSFDEDALPLPRSFRSLTLGMSFSEVEEVLKGDAFFLYRGKPDVSLLAEENNSLIRCAGTSFIQEATFQFKDEILVVFSLVLRRERMDYFTMYQHLTNRYGEPRDLDPSRAYWQTPEVRLVLEKPATLKYIDENFRSNRYQDLEAGVTQEELNRREFLELF